MSTSSSSGASSSSSVSNISSINSSSYSSSSSSSYEDSSLSLSSSSCIQFSLEDINCATNNFDKERILGEGGEATVYKAELYLNSKGQKSLVAVKHLNKNSTEFYKELRIVGKIRHPYVVALHGYCNESGEKILIYEYMKNGSLSDYVKKDSKICLTWKQRLNICLGAAYGLQHLHKETTEFPKGIIHRDVKPANILLDENWVAKVSDFGMFKLSDSAQTHSTMKTGFQKGTAGYFAPEYCMSYIITRKADVYAFGVVLFEVLCRKKPWDRGDVSYYGSENEDVGVWARENVDIEIRNDISSDSLKAYTDVLGRCLQQKRKRRPTMDGVVQSLEFAIKCQERHSEDLNTDLTLLRLEENLSDIEEEGLSNIETGEYMPLHALPESAIMHEETPSETGYSMSHEASVQPAYYERGMSTQPVMSTELFLAKFDSTQTEIPRPNTSEITASYHGLPLKVIIQGDNMVGKTSLINRYVKQEFINLYKETVGVDLIRKDVPFEDRLFTLQLCDVGGRKMYGSSRMSYYRGAVCCILVYDVNSEKSFANVKKWREDFLIDTNPPDRENFPFVMLGNKVDVNEGKSRVVSEESAQAWCASNGNITYFETSAKYGFNVKAAFECITKRAVIKRDKDFQVSPRSGSGISGKLLKRGLKKLLGNANH